MENINEHARDRRAHAPRNPPATVTDPWSPEIVRGDPSASRAWREASSFVELVCLTRDFVLDGAMGHPDPTSIQVDALRVVGGPFHRLSRRGLMVIDAQDGDSDEESDRRAFVSLVCSEGDADELVAFAAKAGLLTGAWSPHTFAVDQIPVNRRSGEITRAIRVVSVHVIDRLAARVGVDAGVELSDGGFRVLVVDPVWGRDGYLWAMLGDFIQTSTPHPVGRVRTVLDVDAALIRCQVRARREVDRWISTALRELADVERTGADARSWQLVVLYATVDDGPDPGRERLDRVTVTVQGSNGGRATTRGGADLTGYLPIWEHLRAALSCALCHDVPGSLAIELSSRTVLAWFPQYCSSHDDAEPMFGYVAGRQQAWARMRDDETPREFAEVLQLMRENEIAAPTTAVDHDD